MCFFVNDSDSNLTPANFKRLKKIKKFPLFLNLMSLCYLYTILRPIFSDFFDNKRSKTRSDPDSKFTIYVIAQEPGNIAMNKSESGSNNNLVTGSGLSCYPATLPLRNILTSPN